VTKKQTDRPSPIEEGRTSLQSASPSSPDNRRARLASAHPDGTQLAADIPWNDGPLPPAAELQAYQEVDPQLVPWLLAAADKEQSHRHEADRAQWAEVSVASAVNAYRSKVGLWLGFVIAIVGLLVAGVTAYVGHPITAGVIGGLDLVSLLAATGLARRASGTGALPAESPAATALPPPR